MYKKLYKTASIRLLFTGCLFSPGKNGLAESNKEQIEGKTEGQVIVILQNTYESTLILKILLLHLSSTIASLHPVIIIVVVIFASALLWPSAKAV